MGLVSILAFSHVLQFTFIHSLDFSTPYGNNQMQMKILKFKDITDELLKRVKIVFDFPLIWLYKLTETTHPECLIQLVDYAEEYLVVITGFYETLLK